MIKAVIFDLDGVLVTTDELHYQAWKQLAEEEGITGFMREDNLRQRGVSRMASLEVVLEKADRQYSDKEKAALAERKNNIYVASLANLVISSKLLFFIRSGFTIHDPPQAMTFGSLRYSFRLLELIPPVGINFNCR